jgi:predicted DNA-binding transcriptional regulator AlpA
MKGKTTEPDSATQRDQQSLRLLSIRQVAELLGISTSTCWRLRGQGTLPLPVRVGYSLRWRWRDIQRFIESL